MTVWQIGNMTTPSAIMRTNPIPEGRYWIDVFGDNIAKADNWFRAMSGLGVKVETTQSFRPTPEEILASGDFPTTDSVKKLFRNFYIFSYTPTGGVPVVWDQTTFGFLSTATPDIKSADDTVQRPDLPLDAADEFSAWIDKLKENFGAYAPFLLLGLAGVVGFELLTSTEVTKRLRRKK